MRTMTFAAILLAVAMVLCGAPQVPAAVTDGWTQFSNTYYVQKPYNLSVSSRFSYSSGVWTTWVYPTDKPFSEGNTTAPRTEMRWNTNWASGARMSTLDMLVVSGTNNCSVWQIHGTAAAVPIMIRSYSTGKITENSSFTLLTNYWGKWFNLKVSWDPGAKQAKVYINDALKLTKTYTTASPEWYFKNGVYGGTTLSKAQYKNIKFWKK